MVYIMVVRNRPLLAALVASMAWLVNIMCKVLRSTIQQSSIESSVAREACH